MLFNLSFLRLLSPKTWLNSPDYPTINIDYIHRISIVGIIELESTQCVHLEGSTSKRNGEEVKRDDSSSEFLVNSCTFCFDMLRWTVHFLNIIMNDLLIIPCSNTPETWFSELRFSEILNPMNKLQLSFLYFTPYSDSI